MDLSSLIASVSTGISTLVELGGLLVGERDRQKAAAIHDQFAEKLIETKAHLLQVLGAVIEQQRQIPVLEQRVRDLEAERAEKQRYVLAKVGSQGEFFAYRLRPAAELQERTDEVPHFACQPCFEVGKKIILVGNGAGYWMCPICKHGAQVEPGGPSGYTVEAEPAFRRGRLRITDGF